MKKQLATALWVTLATVSLSTPALATTTQQAPSSKEAATKAGKTDSKEPANKAKESAKDAAKAAKRWISGNEQYKQFAAEYKEGKFKNQLDKLSTDVEKMLKEHPDLYKQTMSHAKENKGKIEQMNAASEALMTKGLEEMKAACKGDSSDNICVLIASIAANTAGAKAFNDNFMELHSLALSDDHAKNDAFTQRVVDVVDNGMKKLLYPMYSHQPIEEFNPILPKAIEMQMVEQLKELAAKEPKAPLSAKIDIIVKNYPAHYANFIDNQTLSLLANSKIPAKDAKEEAVKKIVQKMEDERKTQLRALFPTQESPKAVKDKAK